MRLVLKHGEGLSFLPPGADVMEKLDRLLAKCDREAHGHVVVDLAFPYRRRTAGERSQNNLLHFLLAEIAKATYQDMEDVKAGIKDLAIKRGYPYYVNPISGRVTPQSSSVVSTVEFAMLIEECYALIAEYGIILPPNPYEVGDDGETG